MKKHKTLVLIIIFTFIVFLASIFLIWYPNSCPEYYPMLSAPFEDFKGAFRDWYIENFCRGKTTIW